MMNLIQDALGLRNGITIHLAGDIERIHLIHVELTIWCALDDVVAGRQEVVDVSREC